MCDTFEADNEPVSERGHGPSRREVAVLLALMFCHACEDCTLILFSRATGGWRLVEDATDGGILANVERVTSMCEPFQPACTTDAVPGYVAASMVQLSLQLVPVRLTVARARAVGVRSLSRPGSRSEASIRWWR